MKILHIDSSVLGANSVSRQISKAAVESLRQASSGFDVTYRDLAGHSLPHLSPEHLAAAQGAVPEAGPVQSDMTESAAALEEFLAADVVVIGAPMYNFTVPSQLKAWIDRILVAGKTFKYEATGPVGLAGGKRVVVAVSRGGVYAPGTAAAGAEHVESYLRAVFGFMGITDVKVIVAEGLQMGPEPREKALTGALQEAGSLKAA